MCMLDMHMSYGLCAFPKSKLQISYFLFFSSLDMTGVSRQRGIRAGCIYRQPRARNWAARLLVITSRPAFVSLSAVLYICFILLVHIYNTGFSQRPSIGNVYTKNGKKNNSPTIGLWTQKYIRQPSLLLLFHLAVESRDLLLLFLDLFTFYFHPIIHYTYSIVKLIDHNI